MNHLTSTNNPKPVDIQVPSCDASGGAAPCWNLDSDMTKCPQGGVALSLMQDQAAMNAASLDSTINLFVTCKVDGAGLPLRERPDQAVSELPVDPTTG